MMKMKKKTMTMVELVVLCLDDGWMMHKVTSLFVLWFESVFTFSEALFRSFSFDSFVSLGCT